MIKLSICISLILICAGCFPVGLLPGGEFVKLDKQDLRGLDDVSLCQAGGWIRNYKGSSSSKYKTVFKEAVDRGLVHRYKMSNVMRGEVEIGMSFCEASLAWGMPDDINQTKTSYSSTAQWVYEGCYNCYEADYLYFRDGLLTAIQE